MNRALFYMAISFSLSCTGLIFLPEAMWWMVALGALFVSVPLLCGIKSPWRGRCFLLCAGIILAVGSITLHNHLREKPFAQLEGQNLTVAGVVSQVDQRDSYCLVTLRATIKTQPAPPESEMRIFVPGIYDWELGDRLTGEIEISLPRDEVERRYMYSQGQYVSGSATGGGLHYVSEFEQSMTPRSPMALGILMRGAMRDALSRVMPGQNGNFVASVLLGDGAMLSEQVAHDMHMTGAGHVLAVSGLHLSVICGVVIRILGSRGANKWMKAGLGSLCAFILAMTVGFTPSVIRAGVMLSLALVGTALGRKSDGLSGLGLAVLGIGLFAPYTMLSWSFLISVTSILSIFTFSVPLEKLLITWRKNRLPHSEFLDTPLCAVGLTLGVMVLNNPLFALLRGSFVNYAVLGNLIIVPLSMFVLMLGGIMTLLGLAGLWGMAEVVALPTEFCVELVRGCAAFIARLPGGLTTVNEAYQVVWLWASGIILAVFVSCGIKFSLRRIAIVCAGLVVALGMGIISHTLLNHGTVVVRDISGSDALAVDMGQVWLLSSDIKGATAVNERGQTVTLATQGQKDDAQNMAQVIQQYSPKEVILHHDTAKEISPYLPDSVIIHPASSATVTLGEQIFLDWGVDFQSLQIGGVEILKLSDGYDIIKDSGRVGRADVVVLADGNIVCNNPHLRLRRDIWGDNRIVFVPYS